MTLGELGSGVSARSCHRPVYPDCDVAIYHQLNGAGEMGPGHHVPRGRSFAGSSAAEGGE